MAANQFTVDSGNISMGAGTPKTVLMVTAPTNIAVVVKGITVSFDGATSTNTPATIELARFSSAGTFTSVTPQKIDPGRDETIQTTAGKDSSSEPTVSSSVETHYLPVYGGVIKIYPPSDSRWIVPGGGRFGIKITAPSSVNARANMHCEE